MREMIFFHKAAQGAAFTNFLDNLCRISAWQSLAYMSVVKVGAATQKSLVLQSRLVPEEFNLR